MVIAEHRTLDFARVHRPLDNNLSVVTGRKVKGRGQFLGVADLADTYRRAQVRRLHEERIADFLLDQSPRLPRVLLPFAPQHQHPLDDRKARVTKQPFHHVLIHPDRRTQDARAHVGDPGQLQQALDRSVLAEGAVQKRKNDVDLRALAPRSWTHSRTRNWRGLLLRQTGRIERDQSGTGRVNRGRDRPSVLEHPRQEVVRTRTDQPPALPGDADGNNLILLRVERLEHRSRRSQRDLVLARPAAEQESQSNFFLHVQFLIRR